VETTIMKRNVGSIERWIRVAAGLVLMTLGLTLPVSLLVEEIAETIGLVAVVTGAIGYCPIKHLFGQVGRNSGHHNNKPDTSGR
jgi:hypothetical protein